MAPSAGPLDREVAASPDRPVGRTSTGHGGEVLAIVAKIVAGLLLIAVGVAAGAIPVLPGWPLVAVGVALVLSQSAPGRRVLSRIRLAARRRWGSDRVRAVERHFPEDVRAHDTTRMRLDLAAYERARRHHRGRRRRRR